MTGNQLKIALTIAVASAVLSRVGGTTHAQTIFTESFETPDITGQWVISGFNADGPWPGWVGANRYTGMLDKSVNVLGSEKSINSFGDQIAYVFNNVPSEDTGASLTTTSDSLDAVLTANTIYTLTFNTASDSGAAINYHVELLAIDASGDVETVLGAATGPVDANDLSLTSDSIVFATGDTHPNLGERVAIRLKKGAGDWHYNIYYDKLQLVAVDPMRPSPEDGAIVPAGDCGEDLTADALDCASFEPCV